MKLNHECLRSTEPKNVIFLDVDGVLNSRRCLSMGEHIDMACARHVRRIALHADADIVISSTWRIGNNTHTLREMFYMCGLYRVIGRTSDNCPKGTSLDERGHEIEEWIKAFGCKKYLILDDDTDFLDHQKINFIKTDAEVGITEEQSTHAIRNIFGVTTPFCPECNGYGRVEEFVKCGSCNTSLNM